MMLLLLLCLLPLALSAPKPKHFLIETVDDKQPQIPEMVYPKRPPKGSNDYQLDEEYDEDDDDNSYDWRTKLDEM